MCVVLGDNIIEKNICSAVKTFEQQANGAHLLLKEVEDPQRFGCPKISGDCILEIEEKPKQPKSNYAVTGIYFFDNTAFDKINRLKPSGRGELEITDVNNAYIKRKAMEYSVLDGWWCDAGESIPSYLETCNRVAQFGANKIYRSNPV